MVKPQSYTPESVYTTKSGTEIKMSFGLFNDVMRILGGTEDAVEVLISDPSVRGFVIRRLFTLAQHPIDQVEDLINPFEIDLDPLEMDDVIAWVADHVMHFTLSTAEKTRPVVERYRDRAATVFSNLSKTGSES